MGGAGGAGHSSQTTLARLGVCCYYCALRKLAPPSVAGQLQAQSPHAITAAMPPPGLCKLSTRRAHLMPHSFGTRRPSFPTSRARSRYGAMGHEPRNPLGAAPAIPLPGPRSEPICRRLGRTSFRLSHSPHLTANIYIDLKGVQAKAIPQLQKESPDHVRKCESQHARQEALER